MTTFCTFKGCDRSCHTKGLCRSHYQQKRRGNGLTPLKERSKRSSCIECEKSVYARNLCRYHYDQRRRGRSRKKNKRIPGTPGAFFKNSCGYSVCFFPEHPQSTKGGLVTEHRLVMERMLGRPLLSEETVHHKNGIRDDNRCENLELWASKHPPGQRASDLLKWAEEIVQTYGNLKGLL